MSKSNKTRISKSTSRNSSSKLHQNSKQNLSAKPAQARTAPKKVKSDAHEGSKLAMMVTMLRSPKGASIVDLCKATGWLAHSVRGAISGAIKKKRDLVVTSTKVDGVRFYRIAD